MYIQVINKSHYSQIYTLLEKYQLSLILEEPGCFILGAFELNEIIGLIKIRQMEIIEFLYAKPNQIQSEIMQELLISAEMLGFRRLVLNVNKQNYPYFKQFGFIESTNHLIKPLMMHGDFKSYEEIKEYFNSKSKRVYSLAHFEKMMQQLYQFHYALKCIHIGGTNGKGSTTTFVKKIYEHAGYDVGSFMSPPLSNRLEVIQTNQPIEENTYIKIVNRYKPLFDYYELSFFEIEVFISIIYFYLKQVDLCIYEVGLGGLLDATNIIYPLVCVNTNIGYDHQEYLGNTLQEIAYNKAGIVKEGIDYLTGEENKEVLEVFKNVCKSKHSHLIQIDKPKNVQVDNTIKYTYHGYQIELNTKAIYQVNNSSLAINIIDYLKDLYPIDKEDVEIALKQFQFPGRFEKIHDKPEIIIDGAHNLEGIKVFLESIKNDTSNYVIIFSALKDKPHDQMIETLLTLNHDIIVTTFEHERQASLNELVKDYPVIKAENYKEALILASNYKKIYITGSLYFLAQVRNEVLRNMN